MNPRISALPLLVLFVIAAQSHAQDQRPQMPVPVADRSFVTYESFIVPAESPDSVIVNFHYRIDRSFFVLVSSQYSHQYIGRAELLIEVFDEHGASVSRTLRQLSYSRPTLPLEGEELGELQEASSMVLPKGRYTYLFALEDLESKRSFIERDIPLHTSFVGHAGFEVISSLFVALPDTSRGLPTSFTALNFGKQIRLGTAGGLLLQCRGEAPSAESLEVKLNGTLVFPADGEQTFTLRKGLSGNGALRLASTEGAITYTVDTTADSLSWIYISTPLARLFTGTFTAQIHFTGRNSSNEERKIEFGIVWKRMPQSLADVSTAIDALEHIASEDEFDELQSASLSRQRQLFFDYWNKKDPDTTDAYNPLLAEYYRRVDSAIKRFSTPRGLDGYKTDRGRIFILYGAPSQSERILRPGKGPVEIWTYTFLGRRYVFTATARNSTPLLTEVRPL